ncbi:lipase [Actinomycetes bacterium]|nr:lipase [Actinomycetes bacterium]
MFTYPILDSRIEIVGALGFDKSADGWVTPRRLPDWTRIQFADAGIERFLKFPSGVRLRFKTSADQITLKVLVSKMVITGLAEDKRPAAFDLLVNGEESQTLTAEHGNVLRLTPGLTAVFVETIEPGDPDLLTFSDLGDDEKEIEIWLPSSAIVELKELSASKEIFSALPNKKKKWVHYGSSISHCIEALRPMDIWPVRAAQLMNLDLTNFGFAGECQLDGFAGRSIANTPADFISLKLGINIVNADSMRERAFIPAVHSLLDTIREKQPTTPILVISPIWCPFHETTPGPIMIDGPLLFAKERPAEFAAGALHLVRIREILEEVVSLRKDKNLHYMNGFELMNEHDVDLMPDKLHPDSAGYRLMGERFAKSNPVTTN